MKEQVLVYRYKVHKLTFFFVSEKEMCMFDPLEEEEESPAI